MRPRNILCVVMTIGLLTGVVETTSAQWVHGGVALSTAARDQVASVITSDGAKGAIVAWQDARTGTLAVYAARVDADGYIPPLWVHQGTQIAAAALDQSAKITSDGVGGAIISWNSANRDAIYALRVDGSGTVQPGWPTNGVQLVAISGRIDGHGVAPDGTGGAFVVWSDNRTGRLTVYAQRILANGSIAPGWPANGLSVCSATSRYFRYFGALEYWPSYQYGSLVISDGVGGMICAWEDRPIGDPGNRSDIYAQRIASTGELLWAADGVPVCTADDLQGTAKICADGSGGAIVAWDDLRGHGDFDIYMQRIQSNGSPYPGWPIDGAAVCTTTNSTQTNPRVVADGSGGGLVLWEDFRADSGGDVFAQHINSSGSVAPGWPTDGSPVSGQATPFNHVVFPDGQGGILVAWNGPGDEGVGIYAQRIAGDGTKQWGSDGVVLFSGPFNIVNPAITGDGEGGALIAWQDWRLSPGSYDVYVQRVYSDGTVGSQLGDTTPPFVTAPPDVQRATGAGATGCAVFIADSDLGEATSTDDDSETVTVTRTGVPAGNSFPVGSTEVTYTATDEAGNSNTAVQVVTVVDDTPPVLQVPVDITRVTDPGTCQASVTYATWAQDNCGGVQVSCSPAPGSAFAIGTTMVSCTATDATGNTAQATFRVTVYNPSPSVAISGPASGAVFAVNTPVTFTGSFTDNNGDVHAAVWAFDQVPAPGTPTIDEQAGTVTLGHTFTSAGVYKVSLTVTDQCGNSGAADHVGEFEAMVVVYDPSAGYVTGGGWIHSPAGAYVPNPALTGKANFGFVSRYKKGATVPTGQTEFQFKVATLNFHSGIYEWLVIAGARAQYRGLGTINGEGSYRFMLTAIDGEQNGGGGTDKFRIKIWDPATDAIVYDNQLGSDDGEAPTTTLGGGSIVIHRDGAPAKPAVETNVVVPGEYALRNFPDPFNPTTTIEFDLPEQTVVSLRVFDVRGKLVAVLADGKEHSPGRHQVEFSASSLGSGIYFFTLQTEGYTATRRMVVLK